MFRRITRPAALSISLALIFSVLAVPQFASAQTSTAPVVITGTVNEGTGAPVAGANVLLRGAQQYSAVTDDRGTFTLSNVAPGVYAVTITKAGYQTASQGDVVAIAGQTQNLTVRMDRVTFSSLRTIASVRSNGRTALNTSPASIDVVTAQTFVDQAQPQLNRILNQIPGIQNSYPSNSTNGASPGSITVPNIRAATSYETASLIDGHPISVGQYGDNVTTFLNPFLFGAVEVVKGPGAESPVVNNAIGGTTNFTTKSPTLTPMLDMLLGVDNRGGMFTNFGFSNTYGKLGFVFDLATNNNPSPLNGKQVYYDPSGGVIPAGTVTGDNSPTNYGSSRLYNQYPLLACCYTFQGDYNQTAELLKLRYKFSNATSMTVSYLDGQTVADQNANTSAFIYGSTFAPGPGYSGSLRPGPVMVANIYPGAPQQEDNIEPIFQAETATTIGAGTLLARYYHATILRYQHGGTTSNPDFNTVNLYGTSSSSAGGIDATFNGNSQNVGFFDTYVEPELDKLSGGTLEYQRQIGNNHLFTFSADRTVASTVDYVAGTPGYSYYYSLPPGTWQMLSTYLLRDYVHVTPRLDLTFSNYLNTYSSTYANGCSAPAGCNTYDAAVRGIGFDFGTTRNTHDDPRLSLVYHATPDWVIRFSGGSTIAPPFLGLLSQVASTPTFDPSSGAAIESVSNSNLKPETAFGLNLGGDIRLPDRTTVVSGDLYYTNLFNRFFGQTVNTGLTCATTFCSGSTSAGVPVLNQTNTNISNARFEGIELSVRHLPGVGFGYQLSGALQKGYYYNLPPYFYCSLPGPGCTMDQNMNVISGQNTNGIPVGFYSISYNGNMRIPYSQANAELSYTFRNGAYASIGDTFYGRNNSFNRPAFGIAYATLRYPLTPHVAFQVSGDNIFSSYPGFLPVYGGGAPIPLADGTSAVTTGNVVGPATYRFMLVTRLP